MKVTKTLIDKLIALRDGESLPASKLKGDWVNDLLRDRILVSTSRGSKRNVKAMDSESFLSAIARIDERFSNLEKMRELILSECTSSDTLRAVQASDSGNSKLRMTRSFPGFLVNSYEAIDAQLNGKQCLIQPVEGSSVFISDWEHFVLPSDVTVIGIENPENFRFIREQKNLFETTLPGKRLLFVSRYPQSCDLRNWLIRNKNTYIHFGDFDLAGIHIFLTEFYAHLGERSSFLIPEDIETRLMHGSRERYHNQYHRFHQLRCNIPTLQHLIELINRCHRCYDQEGYITFPISKD